MNTFYSKLPIRLKFALSSALVLILISTVVVSYLSNQQTQQAIKLMENKIQTMAEMVSMAVGNTLHEGDIVPIYDAFNWVKRDNSLLFITVVGNDSETLAEFNPGSLNFNSTELLKGNGLVWVDHNTVSISVPIQFKDENQGTLLLVYSLEEVFDSILNNQLKAFAICLVILSLGVLVTLFTSKIITQSITQLSKAARSFAEGKNDVSVAINTTDEVGELGEAFNFLVNRVNQNMNLLTISNKELETEIAERTQLMEKLKFAQTRIQTIMDSIVDGVITIDINGIIESINPAAEKIFGYKLAEVQGKNINMLMPEPYRAAHDSYIQRYLSTNISQIIGVGREVTGMRKDESSFPLDLTISEMFLGGRRFFTGVVRDLTQRKEDEKALHRAQEEAEEAEHANSAKSEFLSHMSHELRTPMNAILGFGQLLTYDTRQPLTNSQKAKVSEILKAGNHLLELINEVLDFSHIESGKLSLAIEDVNLNAVVEETTLLITPLAQQRNIQIENRIRDNLNPVFVLADRTKLKQILLNLMSNAVKYNREGGSIILNHSRTANGRIKVSISDTGTGLSKDQQAKIFEPFNRLDAENSSVEGTGIGLTITKRLVKLMNGVISVQSVPEKGSRFSVELPEGKPLPLAEENLVVRTAKKRPDKNQYQKWTLLYVEDNPANLVLVEQILQTRPDIKMLSAPQARLGIELACAHQPDLILMDINMPEMDGITAMKELRNYKETRGIPVIAVSANAMESDIQKGLEAGFNAYIAKPFNIEHFLMDIDHFLKSDNLPLIDSTS